MLYYFKKPEYYALYFENILDNVDIITNQTADATIRRLEIAQIIIPEYQIVAVENDNFMYYGERYNRKITCSYKIKNTPSVIHEKTDPSRIDISDYVKDAKVEINGHVNGIIKNTIGNDMLRIYHENFFDAIAGSIGVLYEDKIPVAMRGIFYKRVRLFEPIEIEVSKIVDDNNIAQKSLADIKKILGEPYKEDYFTIEEIL